MYFALPYGTKNHLKQKLQFPFVLVLKTTDQLDGHTHRLTYLVSTDGWTHTLVKLPSEYSWMDIHIG